MEQTYKRKETARLLIIDDNVEYCTRVANYFSMKSRTNVHYEFQVDVEHMAADAVGRIREIKPHVVILDHFFAPQKLTGLDVFEDMATAFNDDFGDKKLALIYYSNRDLEAMKATNKLYSNVSIICDDMEVYPTIKLKGDFINLQAMYLDVLSLLRGVLEMQPEKQYFGECDRCGLEFNFLLGHVYRGRGVYQKQLFVKPSIARTIAFYLANSPDKWKTRPQIIKCGWSGKSYPTTEAVRKRREDLEEKCSPWIERDRVNESLMMHTTCSCICPEGVVRV